MSVIDSFMNQYKQESRYYTKLSQLCAQMCESGLERNGIRAMVTYRAKRPDRLREKITKRNKSKKYKNIQQIYDDIVDLAGVRIALYFPGDRDEVDALIRALFDVKCTKEFPEPKENDVYERRFAGYSARHYHICLKKESLPQEKQAYADRLVEIQVGSVLMHAWAEVEHDLVYKPLTGQLSDDEYAILDELNGLVHAGEIALERLQTAVKRRIISVSEPFGNHYELSSFIYDQVKGTKRNGLDPTIGRADVLFRFLQLAHLDTPQKLEPYLERLDPDAEHRPITEQIVDEILASNEELYEAYNKARMIVGQTDPFGRPEEAISYFSEERALGFFMRRVIALESVARSVIGSVSPVNFGVMLSSILKERPILDKDTMRKLAEIRKLRNQVIHGMEFPSEEELIAAGRFLEQVLGQAAQEKPELRPIIERALRRSA